MVEYVDGSVLAQLGSPDMRTPIAHALAWPARRESGVQSLDLLKAGVLEFQAPDLQRFRCLALAQDAARAGGLAPAIANAANEVAVAAFLDGRLNFPGIAEVIERVMTRVAAGPALDLEHVFAADAEARRVAVEACRRGRPCGIGAGHEAVGGFSVERVLVPAVVPRGREPAGHGARIRPLLGRPQARLQGAAFLGRLRHAAVEARRRRRSHRIRVRGAAARRLRQAARRTRRARALHRTASLVHAQAALAAHPRAAGGPGLQHRLRDPAAVGMLWVAGSPEVRAVIGPVTPDSRAGARRPAPRRRGARVRRRRGGRAGRRRARPGRGDERRRHRAVPGARRRWRRAPLHAARSTTRTCVAR